MRKHFLLILLLPVLMGSGGLKSIFIDDFEHGLNGDWEVKSYLGYTKYSVDTTDSGKVLKAESDASASALLYRKQFNPAEYPIISWRWKIDGVLEKGDVTKKEGSDFPARLYVLFPTAIPFMPKSINYVWANHLTKGEHRPSVYYKNSIIVAVESGNQYAGLWMEEKRNVYADYKLFFGSEPPNAKAIAIMTDTDDTSEKAIAWYDDIVLSNQ
jgi:hypothetical protein